MKRVFAGLAAGFCFSILPLSLCHAEHLELIIKDFTRSGGRYVIRFSVINKYTYERNPIVALKIMDGARSLACKQISLTVAKGADGSRVHETTIDAPLGEEVILESKIYERTRRNRLGSWFADCP